MIVIEIFTAPNCNRCGRAVTLIEEIITEMAIDNVQCRKVDVLENIDYAVQLGILATPAIVINGKLIFTSLPTKAKLLTTLQDYLNSKR